MNFTWGDCMTFGKLTKAMEATSVFWIKIAPIVRDMVHHYQDIMNDGCLKEEDIKTGREHIKALNKELTTK